MRRTVGSPAVGSPQHCMYSDRPPMSICSEDLAISLASSDVREELPGLAGLDPSPPWVHPAPRRAITTAREAKSQERAPMPIMILRLGCADNRAGSPESPRPRRHRYSVEILRAAAACR